MDFLGVYGKSETLGPCSALAALGTLTCGPRVSDFPYTPRTHRLTYIYSLCVFVMQQNLAEVVQGRTLVCTHIYALEHFNRPYSSLTPSPSLCKRCVMV